jgi:23S rRNA (cytidine1920-2'-O)/16S rRNA (cytidine1409-2'-O)-methyltransferase
MARVKRHRLDALLVARGYSSTPQEAERLIRAGLVWLGSQRLDKPGEQVAEDIALEVRGIQRDVGRGTQKLRQAFSSFSIQVQNKVCVDVGSCSGGFTQVLLEQGARRVYAIDAAQGCLDWKLRTDARVVAMEGTSAQRIESLPEPIQFAVVDVSLVSVRKVLPTVCRWLSEAADLVVLLKPQYEAAKEDLPPGAVIIDAAVHQKICDEFRAWTKGLGLAVSGLVESPILGGSGNKEFLVWLERGGKI